MLDPGVVSVAGARHPVHPARVIRQRLAPVVRNIERRVSDHKIRANIRVQILRERIRRTRPQVSLNTAQRQVHLRQLPRGIRKLLPVDRELVPPAAVRGNKLRTLHKHPARAAARVHHPALKRAEHLNQGVHHRARRVKRPALFTGLLTGKLAQKILVHPAQHIIRTMIVTGAKTDSTDQVHQLAQALLIQPLTAIITR